MADTARRADVEEWLDALGVKWRFADEFPIDKIDRFASLANQARVKALDPDVVERYTADMLRGDRFPPVLLGQKGASSVLVGGNHRIAAAVEAERSTFPAYLVKAEPKALLTRVMYEDNHRHGLPPSDEERGLQVAHLVATGYSMAEAAAIVGVSPSKAHRAVETSAADSRGVAAGILGWAKLASTTRWRLGGIFYDSVFEKVANLTVRSGLVSDTVFDLVAAVNAAETEEESLRVADEACALHAGSNSSIAKKRRTARSRVIAAVDRIVTVDADDVVKACNSKAEQAQLRERADAGLLVLERIIDRLEARR